MVWRFAMPTVGIGAAAQRKRRGHAEAKLRAVDVLDRAAVAAQSLGLGAQGPSRASRDRVALWRSVCRLGQAGALTSRPCDALWRSAAAAAVGRGKGPGKARTAKRGSNRSPRGDGELPAALAPLRNHTWAEVFRTRTTSGWYKKAGVAEGVLYGCWTYPLHAPYSRGTGVFLNVGRTIAFPDRVAAAPSLPGPRTLAYTLNLLGSARRAVITARTRSQPNQSFRRSRPPSAPSPRRVRRRPMPSGWRRETPTGRCGPESSATTRSRCFHRPTACPRCSSPRTRPLAARGHRRACRCRCGRACPPRASAGARGSRVLSCDGGSRELSAV